MKKMNKGFTLIELMACIIICGIVLAFATLFVGAPITKLVGWNSEYSSGERTGVVTKISKKGIYYKTWEGEMNTGGMSADGGGVAVPNIWKFSVANDEIAQQVMHAASTGKRVTLRYTELYKTSWKQGDTDYLIVEVRMEE